MVGLLILKHVRDLSDESVVEQWSENIYYQYFCGQQEFVPYQPCASSELVHFRHRIGIQGCELILKKSVRINGKDGGQDDISADTTVQQKNITYPMDNKLHHKIIKKCKKMAKHEGHHRKNIYADRGYKGKTKIGDTNIHIPKPFSNKLSQYQQRKRRKGHQRRAAIEPIIGHLKQDHRLSRNFYKGDFGDAINVILAAAFNVKRMMNIYKKWFAHIFHQIKETLFLFFRARWLVKGRLNRN